MSDLDFESELEELSLLETLDHALNRGLVITGEITISVANVDLVFLGLNVLLSSVETIDQVMAQKTGRKSIPPDVKTSQS